VTQNWHVIHPNFFKQAKSGKKRTEILTTIIMDEDILTNLVNQTSLLTSCTREIDTVSASTFEHPNLCCPNSTRRRRPAQKGSGKLFTGLCRVQHVAAVMFVGDGAYPVLLSGFIEEASCDICHGLASGGGSVS
jgi:hypothetical protein